MKKRIAKNAIKAIALREGISVAAVRNEMIVAIEAAYQNPYTRAIWNERFGDGVVPTPEEFIVEMACAIA